LALIGPEQTTRFTGGFDYEGEVCTEGAASVKTAAGEFSFRNFSQKEGILGFVEKYIVYKK